METPDDTADLTSATSSHTPSLSRANARPTARRVACSALVDELRAVLASFPPEDRTEDQPGEKGRQTEHDHPEVQPHIHRAI